MSALEPFMRWLGEASWQAAVIALLVLAVQWLAGPRLPSGWRYALWFLVIVRLMLPAIPESRTSIYQFASEMSSPFADSVAWSDPVAVALPANEAAGFPPAPEPSPVRKPFPLGEFLTLIWLAGFAGLFARGWILRRGFHRRLRRTAMPVSSRLAEMLASAAAELRVKVPRAVESSAVSAPALIGLFRPCVLLPRGFEQRFSAEEIRCVFRHELAHLRRGDGWINEWTNLLQMAHWFNPILWLAFRRMRADREAACDALALRMDGASGRQTYGRALLKSLEDQAEPPAFGSVGILEDPHQLKERMKRIANHRPARWFASITGACLLIGLAAVALTRPTRESARPLPAESDMGETVFLEAIKRNDPEEVGNLIRSGANPNRPISGFGHAKYLSTPLQIAIGWGALASAQALLNAGAEVNGRDAEGLNAAFHVGISLQALQLLLDHGIDIRTPADNGMTVLHTSIIAGPRPMLNLSSERRQFLIARQLEVVDRLLDLNAEPEARADLPGGFPGMTPLIWAILWDQPREVIELLLNRGANVNVSDGQGRTPLVAAFLPLDQMPRGEIVDLLLARGAEVNPEFDRSAESAKIPSPLKASFLSVDGRQGKAGLESGRKHVVDLLRRGARFEGETNSESHVLLRAASEGDAGRLADLLLEGRSPNDADAQGWTPLMSAAALGYSQILRQLLDVGADTNLMEAGGEVALSLAIRGSANPNDIDRLLKTTDVRSPQVARRVLSSAIRRQDPGIFEKLLEAGATTDALWQSEAEAAPRLTLLQRAIGAKQFKMAILLLRAGANPNPPSNENRSPLYWAIDFRAVELVRALIDSGADLNVISDYQESIKVMAERSGIPAIQDAVQMSAQKTSSSNLPADSAWVEIQSWFLEIPWPGSPSQREALDQKIKEGDLRGLDALAAVKLISAPSVTVPFGGEKVRVEVTEEFRYPAKHRKEPDGGWIPVIYDSRRLGPALEIEPALSNGGIYLQAVYHHTSLRGFNGEGVERQPVFETHESRFFRRFENDKLAGFWLSAEAEGEPPKRQALFLNLKRVKKPSS